MDFQHRPGAKTGGGGVASWSETNKDRRERLRQLALETIDITKDPYFLKNHLGTYECKLCLTLHNNEGSYLAHTQGKKHQHNLARRAAKEAKDNLAQQQIQPTMVLADQKMPMMGMAAANNAKKKFVKIGRPGYKVTKQKDPETNQCSLLFQIDYPEIADGIAPRHRFMSAYEQRIEPPDKKWQYLLFAAEPYETIAFKVPSREVDKPPGISTNLNTFGGGILDERGNFGGHGMGGTSFVNYIDKKFWYLWNAQAKQFYLQFAFKLTPSEIALYSKPVSHAISKSTESNMIETAGKDKEEVVQSAGVDDLMPPPPPPLMGLRNVTNSEPAPDIPGSEIKHQGAASTQEIYLE